MSFYVMYLIRKFGILLENNADSQKAMKQDVTSHILYYCMWPGTCDLNDAFHSLFWAIKNFKYQIIEAIKYNKVLSCFLIVHFSNLQLLWLSWTLLRFSFDILILHLIREWVLFFIFGVFVGQISWMKINLYKYGYGLHHMIIRICEGKESLQISTKCQ